MPGAENVPSHLPTPPQHVIDRLIRQGIVVRSVWFPSRTDVAAWDQSGCPLYIRQLGERQLEVGPRLYNMWASVFSPVLALELSDHPDGSVLTTRRRFTHVTTAVLVTWLVSIVIWGASIVLGFAPDASLFWLVLFIAMVLAPVVGWTRGGPALDAGIPWLIEVVLAPDEEEDW